MHGRQILPVEDDDPADLSARHSGIYDMIENSLVARDIFNISPNRSAADDVETEGES